MASIDLGYNFDMNFTGKIKTTGDYSNMGTLEGDTDDSSSATEAIIYNALNTEKGFSACFSGVNFSNIGLGTHLSGMGLSIEYFNDHSEWGEKTIEVWLAPNMNTEDDVYHGSTRISENSRLINDVSSSDDDYQTNGVLVDGSYWHKFDSYTFKQGENNKIKIPNLAAIDQGWRLVILSFSQTNISNEAFLLESISDSLGETDAASLLHESVVSFDINQDSKYIESFLLSESDLQNSEFAFTEDGISVYYSSSEQIIAGNLDELLDLQNMSNGLYFAYDSITFPNTTSSINKSNLSTSLTAGSKLLVGFAIPQDKLYDTNYFYPNANSFQAYQSDTELKITRIESNSFELNGSSPVNSSIKEYVSYENGDLAILGATANPFNFSSVNALTGAFNYFIIDLIDTTIPFISFKNAVTTTSSGKISANTTLYVNTSGIIDRSKANVEIITKTGKRKSYELDPSEEGLNKFVVTSTEEGIIKISNLLDAVTGRKYPDLEVDSKDKEAINIVNTFKKSIKELGHIPGISKGVHNTILEQIFNEIAGDDLTTSEKASLVRTLKTTAQIKSLESIEEEILTANSELTGVLQTEYTNMIYIFQLFENYITLLSTGADVRGRK